MMRQGLHTWLICAMVAILGNLLLGDAAFAQGHNPTGEVVISYEATASEGNLLCPDRYDGITGRVVGCIQSLVVNATKTFLATVLPVYEKMLAAALILAVTFYGFMMSIGALSRPASQTFFTIFKVGAVAFLGVGFGGMVDDVFNVMQGLLQIVANYVTVSPSSHCSQPEVLNQVFPVSAREAMDVWDMVDCMFLSLLGFGLVEHAVSGETAAAAPIGLLALMASLMFLGGLGILILICIFFFLLTLMFAVVRAMKIYLISVIAIAFLLAVSPFMIPLVLFSHTKPMFDNWLKNLINFILLPVFLYAFLAMILAAYDVLIFKGQNSLYYILANEPSQHPGFNMKEWLEKGIVNGEAVGAGIDNVNAQTIAQYIKECPGNEDELGEICSDIPKLEEMYECARNPKIPPEDSSVPATDAQDGCEAPADWEPYYGFEMNQELFHFGLAPNVATDKDEREREQEGECSGLGCITHTVGSWLSSARDALFEGLKNFFGAILRLGGVLFQIVGNAMKGLAQFVDVGCNFTPTPGFICDGAASSLAITGSMVHGVGTAANFAGRVLMNGLLEELGDLFESWFDFSVPDFHKIAAYHCKLDHEVTDPVRDANANLCKTAADVVYDLLYLFITALVIAYLMFRWLNFIPVLGKDLIGAARIEGGVPGEDTAADTLNSLKTGMEKALSKKRPPANTGE